MPKLKRKKKSGTPGEWYLDISNYGTGPPVYTLQIKSAGRDILLNADLDHNDTPKRTAYVDWDLYHTLDDLDLLYTKGDSSNSANTDLQPADDQPLEDLSPKQRVAFASSLAKHESAERLARSEHILNLFQSLSPKASGYSELLAEVLKQTPFEPNSISTLDTCAEEYRPAQSPSIGSYDPVVLALITKLVFKAFDSDTSELFNSVVETKDAYELWLLEESLALGGNEIILYPIAEHLEQELTKPVRKQLQADSIDAPSPLSHRFFKTIYTCLSKRQHQTELEQFGTTVGEEVQTGHFLLFPKPTDRSHNDLQAYFTEKGI